MRAVESEMTNFTLTYDGPAMAAGRMPVRDLAPALLALGELFQAANTIIDPIAAPVSLEVRAFERGSFGVDLNVVKQLGDLLNQHPGIEQSAILIGLITDSANGLFAFVRWLRNRRIAERTDAGDGSIQIQDNSGNVFNMPNSVLNLYESPRVRRLARDVVQPLKEPGIDELRIERENVPPLTLREGETEGFDVQIPEETLEQNELTMYVTVVSAVFNRGNKWRFTAGGIPAFWATIEDERFWDRIEARGDLFGFGDVLRVRMRMVQSRNPRGDLETEWTVIEVLEHTPGHNPTPPLWTEEGDEQPSS
jgi:hypothetical protein